jgi:uncharacterized protein YdhG (YjbR/CyaY superfamily)
MNTSMKKYDNVDQYINDFPENVQKILIELRETVRKAAPDATEYISYGMPAYKQNGILIYFAAFKKHIGFYATPDGHAEFKVALSIYKTGKGSVQFPIQEPMPLELITKMVKFRVAQNLSK